MADVNKIKQIAAAKSKLAEKAVDGFVGELESTLKRLNSRVASLVKKLSVGKNGRLVSDQVNLARAAQARSEIDALLREAGYRSSAAKLVQSYDDLAVLSKDALRAGGVLAEFTRADIASIQALKDLDFRRWVRFGDDIVEAVNTRIVESVVGLADFGSMVESIQEILLGGDDQDRANAVARAETIANTLTQGFDRTVTMRKAAEAGIDTFVYLGPDDNLTRPFCEAALSGSASKKFSIPASETGVYTREQIEQMENGVPGLPVMEFGGGYNCRHRFAPVTGKVAQEVKS